ncbi:polysaccharide pyruvyl transferase family protein [Coprococcus comes]|uniref:polysaccharide pyruvyl transferase family protein n=1 Tax=Coprococcus comes TaxID=410072 RepID=UPI00319D9FC5
MVVNVITRHAPTNYGSLLQAIATQRVIMNLGHECRIINYIPKCETGVRMAITQLEQKTKWRRNPIKKAIYLMVAEPETLLMDRKFLAMRKKYLLMGPCCATTGELKKLYAEKKDEVFLTGSDQVWGPISTGHYDPTYFLDFVPKSSRKLAFAASFGKAIFDEQTLKEYGVLLKKYDSLAVRENVAVELLKKMDISAKQVLDPTLLMDADAWSEYVKPMKKPEKYVLVYQIHANSDLDHYAVKFAEKAELPLLRVSPLLHQAKRSGKFVYCPDISGFLDLVKNADYMVTDSFHGTAFAINFNTQFVEVLPNTGTSSRNQSILELTGLTDRIVRDLNDFSYIDQEIDFKEANEKIGTSRIESIRILEEMLAEQIGI